MNRQIVLSTNTNTNYIEYWQHVSKAYKLIFNLECSCAFVYENQKEYDQWMPYLEKYGNVIPIKSRPDIDSGNQAKLARMYIAGKYYSSHLVTINDMDLLPLQKEWLDGKITDYWKPDCIMCLGGEVYDNTPDKGKFPMGNLTAEGRTIQEIINPQNLDFHNYIGQFIGMSDIDHKEDVSKKWYEFSDESVLRAMMKRWNQPERELRIPFGYNLRSFKKTVSRCSMHKFDKNRLNRGEYVEFHMPHPYNREVIEPFLKYIETRYENNS